MGTWHRRVSSTLYPLRIQALAVLLGDASQSLGQEGKNQVLERASWFSWLLGCDAEVAAGWIETCHTLMGKDDRVAANTTSYVRYGWGQSSGRWRVRGHLSPEARMFSNLRLRETPRSPPDGRQPVSLFKRKITRAGCQGGGPGCPPSTTGKLISLIFRHLQLKTGQLQEDQKGPGSRTPTQLPRIRKAEPETLPRGLARVTHTSLITGVQGACFPLHTLSNGSVHWWPYL